jgi:diacylglycerol kinase (ATP)
MRAEGFSIATYRNIHLIYNPAAGRLVRSREASVPRLESILRRQGASVTLRATEVAGHATELARQAVSAGADLVLVLGGDGAVNEAINGLVHSEVPLGVLPGGTANILASELGLARSPEETAKLLPELVPQRLSVGLLTPTAAPPRYFLLMAGVGLDARIVVSVDPELKKRVGKLAYWIGGFGQLGRQVPEFLVTVNGDVLPSSFALASRVRNYGGDLEIAKSASLLEDYFELVSFQGEDSFRYLKYLTGVLANLLHKMQGVSIQRVRHVEFRPKDQEILVQVDGEPAGKLPARVELVPAALTVLIPPAIHRKYGTADR